MQSRKILLYLRFLLLPTFFAAVPNVVFANKADSLLNQLTIEKVDSLKAHTYIRLAAEYMYINSDSCLFYANKALEFEGKAKPIIIAKAHKYIGASLREKGLFKEALDEFQQSMDLLRGTDEWNGFASAHNNMGLVYYDMGNFVLALDHLYKAIQIAEIIGNKNSVLTGYINVGLVYDTKENNLIGLKYYHKALKIALELNDLFSLALLYNNIGFIHQKNKEYDAAIRELDKAIYYSKITSSRHTLAFAYNNISVTYHDHGDQEKAKAYMDSSFAIRKESNDVFGMGMCYFNYGIWEMNDGNYKKSEEQLLLSYDLSYKSGSNFFLSKVSRGLSELYLKTNRFKDAYQYRDSFYKYDQIINSEKSAREMQEIKTAFEMKQKQEEIDKIKQEQKLTDIANDEKVKRQQLIIYAILSGILILAFSLVLVYKQYKEKTKANNEILIQKELIQIKNKEIIDSLEYAKRIQGVLLASDKLLKENLPDHFIYFKPKDIVSGDFYWAVQNKNDFYLIIADCTGHGVPGAFMSLLTISLLRETITERGITSPEKILNTVRDRIIESLNPDGSDEVQKDGMDCVLVKFTKGISKIEFACANNPVWLYRNNTRIEFKPDKMPVGVHGHIMNSFTLHQMEMQDNDTLYLFTDGIADQFGGDAGKKYKYSKLNELFQTIHPTSISEQKKKIESEFITWKGVFEQTDDVCVFGIKF